MKTNNLLSKSIFAIAFCFFFLLSSCKKESATPLLKIGDNHQGGIIAYLLLAGDSGYDAKTQHGLIVAPTDQSTGIVWSVASVSIGATATALGTGNENTSKIVANQGDKKYASKTCADLVIGSYSDWYLPSKDELDKLFINKVAVGGVATARYWSSSEVTSNSAFWQDMAMGTKESYIKSSTYHVRAMRSF